MFHDTIPNFPSLNALKIKIYLGHCNCTISLSTAINNFDRLLIKDLRLKFVFTKIVYSYIFRQDGFLKQKNEVEFFKKIDSILCHETPIRDKIGQQKIDTKGRFNDARTVVQRIGSRSISIL